VHQRFFRNWMRREVLAIVAYNSDTKLHAPRVTPSVTLDKSLVPIGCMSRDDVSIASLKVDRQITIFQIAR
jgi:hypothetical protein